MGKDIFHSFTDLIDETVNNMTTYRVLCAHDVVYGWCPWTWTMVSYNRPIGPTLPMILVDVFGSCFEFCVSSYCVYSAQMIRSRIEIKHKLQLSYTQVRTIRYRIDSSQAVVYTQSG
jgi:hypothetical protein